MISIARKSTFALSIVLSLTLCTTQMAHSSSIKSGASCSKKGTVQKVGNRKYTCILKNKRLIWDAGVLIATPKTTPIPTPTKTEEIPLYYGPEPVTKTLDPKYPKHGDSCAQNSIDVIGYNNRGEFVDLMCNGDKYAPRPASMNPFQVDPNTGLRIPNKIYLPLKTQYGVSNLENLNPADVLGRARQEVNIATKSTNVGLAAFNFHIGTSVAIDKSNDVKQSMNLAANVWGSIFKPVQQIEAILYDYLDIEWANTLYKSLTGADQLFSSKNCTKTYCGDASNNIVNNSPIVFEQGMGMQNPVLKGTAPHEYTHTAQLAGSRNYWTEAPLWLVEGMASFYGEAIGYAPVDSQQFIRIDHHKLFENGIDKRGGEKIYSRLTKGDSAEIAKIMKEIEFPADRYSEYSASLAYLVGGYATEVLVAVYGHQKVSDFVISFKDSNNWEQNFRKIFGISKEDFYLKLTPYLALVSAELK